MDRQGGATPSVVVVGSINIDLIASTRRHPVPGETVTGATLEYLPGGKGANQAVAAARAGASARMIGAVGGDAFAQQVLGFLRDAGVDLDSVKRYDEMVTGTALIVVDAQGQNTIVVVPGANAAVDGSPLDGMGVGAQDVVVAQYETPITATIEVFRQARARGAACLLNPAPATPTPPELLELVDVLVVNETELATLAGTDIPTGMSQDEIVTVIRQVHHRGFSGVTIATLGRRGALAVDGGDIISVPGYDVRAIDTTGAGDCFIGSLAAELAGGAALHLAIEYANAAAAVCVTKPGAGPAMPPRTDVDAFRRSHGPGG